MGISNPAVLRMSTLRLTLRGKGYVINGVKCFGAFASA
jgi:hypothetical protein